MPSLGIRTFCFPRTKIPFQFLHLWMRVKAPVSPLLDTRVQMREVLSPGTVPEPILRMPPCPQALLSVAVRCTWRWLGNTVPLPVLSYKRSHWCSAAVQQNILEMKSSNSNPTIQPLVPFILSAAAHLSRFHVKTLLWLGDAMSFERKLALWSPVWGPIYRSPTAASGADLVLSELDSQDPHSRRK